MIVYWNNLSNVIDLNKYRQKKNEKKYNPPASRDDRIQASLEKISKIMAELKKHNEGLNVDSDPEKR